MAVLDCPGGTGDYRTDFTAKAAALASGLDPAGGDFEFGLLHVKAVDDAGHDRKVNYKVAYLAAVDAMVAQLAARLAALEVRLRLLAVLLFAPGDFTFRYVGPPFHLCFRSCLISFSYPRAGVPRRLRAGRASRLS